MTDHRRRRCSRRGRARPGRPPTRRRPSGWSPTAGTAPAQVGRAVVVRQVRLGHRSRRAVGPVQRGPADARSSSPRPGERSPRTALPVGFAAAGGPLPARAGVLHHRQLPPAGHRGRGGRRRPGRRARPPRGRRCETLTQRRRDGDPYVCLTSPTGWAPPDRRAGPGTGRGHLGLGGRDRCRHRRFRLPPDAAGGEAMSPATAWPTT